MKIAAGIVLFNPDIMRLAENMSAVLSQINNLILVDNASNNIAEIEKLLDNYPQIELIKNIDNKGIAKALNQLCELSVERQYEWLLTLDQDSVIPACMIENYRKYIDFEKVALICCKIIDRNYGEMDRNNMADFEIIDTCMTSGTMLKLTAWQTVGGFCEEMFIDGVDFDMSLLIIEHGWEILKVNSVTLLHEIGKSHKVHFLRKELMVYNHSPLRCYYMIRNYFLLGKRHKQKKFFYLLEAAKRATIIILFEKNKWKKIGMMTKGVFHAAIGKYGKLL